MKKKLSIFHKTILDNIESLVVCIALIFSIVNFIILQTQRREQNQWNILGMNSVIQDKFFQNPELYILFYDEEKLNFKLEDSTINALEKRDIRIHLDILAEMHCDMFDRILFTEFAKNEQDMQSWEDYIKDVFEKSLPTRCFLNENKGWYKYLYKKYENQLSCDYKNHQEKNN